MENNEQQLDEGINNQILGVKRLNVETKTY